MAERRKWVDTVGFALLAAGAVGLIVLVANGRAPWPWGGGQTVPGGMKDVKEDGAKSAGALADEVERAMVEQVRTAIAGSGTVRYTVAEGAVIVHLESGDTGRKFDVVIRPSSRSRSIIMYVRTKRAAKPGSISDAMAKANEFNRRLIVGRAYVDSDRELMVEEGLSLIGGADAPGNLTSYARLLASTADDLVQETLSITDDTKESLSADTAPADRRTH